MYGRTHKEFTRYAARWRETWQKLGLTVDSFEVDLRLYPPPLGLAFDRGLHFIASLSRA